MFYKTLCVLIILSNILRAQYYGERSTEQNFEQSQLHFNSHFLNPYGIFNFKDVAVGLIDHPFLNLQVNPANVPSLEKEKDIYFYLDFRGDRTEVPVGGHYAAPAYYINDFYHPYIDPRFLSVARTEPEPIVSLGVITKPLSSITSDFFIGSTYQVIYREEKFYSLPYWIYNSRYYYNSFGVYTEGMADIPIEDRYSGKDEMLTEAHLYSAFAGYKLIDKLSIGLNFSGVTHSREGGYLNIYNDEFSSTGNSDRRSEQSRGRIQEYDHFDVSAGVKYNFTPLFSVGVKAGFLEGNADQSYDSKDDHFYKHNIPNVSPEWYQYMSNSSTIQKWNHDGGTKYLGFNFSKINQDGIEFRGYYKFTITDIDVSSSSSILDTSNHTSRWIYDTTWSRYWGYSTAYDTRSGVGTREKTGHQFMLNFKWATTENSSVIIGLYFNSRKTNVHNSEPVNALRISDYQHESSDPQYNHSSYYSLYEKKTLVWDYESNEMSFQIPVVLQFKFNEKWIWVIGVNRILNNWRISDQTTAYFGIRTKNDNGEIVTETNFGERYTQPAEKISENFTKFFTGVDFILSSSFKARLLLDPEFEDMFHFAQWWLSIETQL